MNQKYKLLFSALHLFHCPIKALIFSLSFLSLILFSKGGWAIDCADGMSPTSSCSGIEIQNPNTVITIDSLITINNRVLQGRDAAVFNDRNPEAPRGANGVSLTNNGTITSTAYGIYNFQESNPGRFFSNGWIENLSNNNTITSEDSSIYNITGGIDEAHSSLITNLTNTGQITSINGYAIQNYGYITTITNTGIMLSNSFSAISNYGQIGTLNNSQGALSSALTYEGNLPTNYNIIINSTSHYGQIDFSSPNGPTSFGISLLSGRVTQLTYSGVMSGVTSSNFTNYQSVGTSWGKYLGVDWQLIETSSSIWDLNFFSLPIYGPSTADTQASLSNQARRLRSTFNSTMASSNFANMNTYDCNLFDKNNMCISAGGRYTSIDNPSSNNSAAVVVLGYKVNSNIRIGGFLDQSVNNNTPTGIQVSNKNPMMGAFAVWNQNADGLGYQVKIANAYQDKDVRSTRDAYGDTGEAGTGKTNLNTQSYVGELSYAFNYQDSTIVRPYFALRYTNIKQDAYAEDSTVSTPLSYAKLSDRSTAALMGVKLNHALTPRTNLTASLGLEQDINHKTDQLTASGVADLTSENFNNHIKRTRPAASAGAYYAVTKTQRLSGEVYYQQLPFQSTGSTTAYVNYMIGF